METQVSRLRCRTVAEARPSETGTVAFCAGCERDRMYLVVFAHCIAIRAGDNQGRPREAVAVVRI